MVSIDPGCDSAHSMQWQNEQYKSREYDYISIDTGMGQNIPKEWQGGPQEGNLPQSLRHRTGIRYDDLAGVIPYEKLEAFFKENL